MGVPRLWQALAPCRQDQSLAELIISEALIREERGEHPLCIGVDANPWMYSAQASILHAQRCGASRALTGSDAERNVLLQRLSQLVDLPANFGFVFDGPAVPNEKRNTHVGTRPHGLTRDFKDLIDGFGFLIIDAPGEAEAELAYLNKTGAIDFVMTPDSDVFLFGARAVIRLPQNPDDRDLVQVYTEESLLAHDPLRHSIAGIFFVAVVSGADYDPAGLPNCGFDTAYALASTEHARSLWHGLHDLQSNTAELSAFLKSWRDILRNELRSNQHGLLTCRRPALADDIPDTFPDPRILKLYAFPAISEGSVNMSEQSAWSCPYLTLPKTGMLTRLMCRFNWSWEKTLATLTKHVWTGHFARQLIDIDEARRLRRYEGLGIESFMWIGRFDRTRRSLSAFPYLKVQISPVSVSAEALSVYQEEARYTLIPGDIVESEFAMISVPAPILHRALPVAVEEFHHRHRDGPPATYWPELRAKIENMDRVIPRPNPNPVAPITFAQPKASNSSEDLEDDVLAYRVIHEGGKEVYEIL